MKANRLLWRMYMYFLLAALAALTLATGHAVHTLRRFHEARVADALEVQGRLAARELLPLSPERDADQIDRLCKEVGALTRTRMTVILPGGRVVGDSNEDPTDMDNHTGRPEIADAFRGKIGTSVRYSDTLRQKLKYMAVPVRRGGVIVAVVRISQPLAEIQWTQQAISRQLLVGGLFAAALFALVALYLSRRTTRPLENMRRIAQRLAEGDLTARVAVSTDDEIGDLARTLNHMAAQLGDRMDTIVRQQVEQHAVLTCMAEGVLAVDTEGRILYLNDAVGRLLGVEPDRARGRSVQETVRHHDVQAFITATLTNTATSEAESLVRGFPEHHIQMHGTPLVEPDGGRIGGLVVMNDITRLKRLEQVRSDFVANVSHELKTPITALKACVETLFGDTPPDPEDAARFTAMISRHVCRLEAIVEDLLSLSRIEFEATNGQAQHERVSIGDMLWRVVNTFALAAEAKHMSLSVVCPDDLSVSGRGLLLEQAIGNLVDNAVKYGSHDTRVSLTAKRDGEQIVIEVTDQGPGIEKKHLPRIFERFYRVDKARSRALGGTGLGLSIVKHIILAHRGTVAVESTVGCGTTFTLRLPRA